MPGDTYEVYTLFDVTYTGTKRAFNNKIIPFIDNATQQITNFDEWSESRNQQRNFDTVIQLLGLRTQITTFSMPVCYKNVELSKFEFGEQYTGIANVWHFTCEFESPHVLVIDNNPVAILQVDFDKIPMILGLEQTLKINEGYFCTGVNKSNIYFQK